MELLRNPVFVGVSCSIISLLLGGLIGGWLSRPDSNAQKVAEIQVLEFISNREWPPYAVIEAMLKNFYSPFRAQEVLRRLQDTGLITSTGTKAGYAYQITAAGRRELKRQVNIDRLKNLQAYRSVPLG